MKRTLSPFFTAVAGGALVVVVAILPLLNLSIPGILPGATYLPGTLQLLALAMLISALALSYHLLFGVASELSFGHALFFAAGAYGLGILLNTVQLSWLPHALVFPAAIVMTILLGVVLAVAVGAVSLRVSGISFAMVTLAFAQAGSIIVGRNPGGATGGSEGLSLSPHSVPAIFFGVVNTKYLYWLCLAILVIVYVAVLAVEKSRAGHTSRAVGQNVLRAEVLGIRSYGIRLLIFVAASALAVVCGVAFSLLQSGATPTITSSDFTLSLLVIVVLGGVGFRWGAIVGGVVYTLLDQRLTAFAGSDFVLGLPSVLRIPLSEPQFILGTLFIIVVIFLPGGIAGFAARLRTRTATKQETFTQETFKQETE
jgi:ABC-type branched-subunit amino acid transport system permease subunit